MAGSDNQDTAATTTPTIIECNVNSGDLLVPKDGTQILGSAAKVLAKAKGGASGSDESSSVPDEFDDEFSFGKEERNEERVFITAVHSEEDEEEEKSKCTKKNVIKFLAGLGIIAITVALIMIFAVKKEEKVEIDRSFLEELLLKYFDTPLHSDALTWLTDEDAWSPPEDSKTTVVTGPNGEAQSLWDALLVERYALAVFYYETNGDGWSTNNRWLSDQSVCDWYNKKSPACNARGQIVDLGLCKS